jgi:putative solute:sodium symporter small subunit
MGEAVSGGEREELGAERSSAGYWRANVRLQVVLLAVWAVCGYVLSIIFAEPLNDVTVGGFPLAFWIAQNGAIIVFVILIFVYAYTMDRVDHEYGVQEEELGSARRRAQRRMQRRLTGEAPADASEEVHGDE